MGAGTLLDPTYQGKMKHPGLTSSLSPQAAGDGRWFILFLSAARCKGSKHGLSEQVTHKCGGRLTRTAAVAASSVLGEKHTDLIFSGGPRRVRPGPLLRALQKPALSGIRRAALPTPAGSVFLICTMPSGPVGDRGCIQGQHAAARGAGTGGRVPSASCPSVGRSPAAFSLSM